MTSSLEGEGGGLSESHFRFFTVFNMGDPQKKVLKCKINHIFVLKKHVIPKQGGGGVPNLGKIPTFSRFFFSGNVPESSLTAAAATIESVWNEQLF